MSFILKERVKAAGTVAREAAVSAQLIDLTIENRVARLTLQRPDVGNVFDTAMLTQMLAALKRAGTEADIVLLAGAGGDFSLGRDRKEPKGSGTPYHAFNLITEVNTTLAALPGIVVTAVQGRAFGFAVGLVMRCDIAIAADDSRFALDEVSLGIPPMLIMAEIFEHLPPKHALDMVLSSREIAAGEAQAMGLISRVVPATQLRTSADAFVAELRGRDPAVLAACKRYFGSGRHLPAAARGPHSLVEQTRFTERNRH